MIDFNKLVETSSQSFENKIKAKIANYSDKVLADANLPTRADIENLNKQTYEKILNNSGLNQNFNSYNSFGDSNPINNSVMLGLASKEHNNSDINNNPSVVMSKAKSKNMPSGVFKYPLSSDEDEQIPYMEIKGFKYSYDANDALGNKNSSSSERTATVLLPLPGNLASGLSLQYEDYSSVFAKLVRAYNGEDASLSNIKDDMASIAEGMSPGVTEDAKKIGMLAGGTSMVTGGGLGGSIGAGLDESLKYIRVNAGITVNPMSQASYIGSNIRTHSFEFIMIPRNAQEAMECKKIIETLQFNSIGERKKELGGILMNYPSVWNVSFKNQDGTPINGILEIPDSFLTDVNVTYSPTRAGFTLTRDNDPFAYILTLTFKEAQNLIRDDLSLIRQGGDILSTPSGISLEASNAPDSPSSASSNNSGGNPQQSSQKVIQDGSNDKKSSHEASPLPSTIAKPGSTNTIPPTPPKTSDANNNNSSSPPNKPKNLLDVARDSLNDFNKAVSGAPKR